MKKNLAPLIICCIAAISSCNIINPSETVPTYVHIDSFVMQNTNPALGSISHDIRSVYVYHNNNLLGAYDLPATVPIAMKEKSKISVYPAISFAGLQSWHVVYPYYQFDTLTIEPKPGEIINFTPKTGYFPDALARYKEDFELGNGFIKLYEDDTSLVRTNDPQLVFEGSGSGYAYLDNNHPRIEVITSQGFSVPAGQDAYLEINYKCSVDFKIGIQTVQKNGELAYSYLGGVKPKDEWGKIYLGIQQFTGTYRGDEYRLMLNAELPEGQQSAYVLLDNIKIITF